MQSEDVKHMDFSSMLYCQVRTKEEKIRRYLMREGLLRA